jgi:phosphatidylserine decarboxylase
VAKDVYMFLLPLIILGIFSLLLNIPFITIALFVLAGFVCYFFRNPNRIIPEGNNLVVSPADGKVVRISRKDNGDQTISIFLNIFNVHVNRSPIAGKLEKLKYRRGKFKPAFNDEASRINEQNVFTIADTEIRVVVRQIAGLIARRVVSWKQPGDRLKRGELIGLIRFGSRVDIVLPERVNILVKKGDKVRGGSSVIGEYK